MKIAIKIGNKIYKNKQCQYEDYEDLVLLQKLMIELGFNEHEMTLENMNIMWNKISEEFCAQWLGVPKTKENLLDFLGEISVDEYY